MVARAPSQESERSFATLGPDSISLDDTSRANSPPPWVALYGDQVAEDPLAGYPLYQAIRDSNPFDENPFARINAVEFGEAQENDDQVIDAPCDDSDDYDNNSDINENAVNGNEIPNPHTNGDEANADNFGVENVSDHDSRSIIPHVDHPLYIRRKNSANANVPITPSTLDRRSSLPASLSSGSPLSQSASPASPTTPSRFQRIFDTPRKLKRKMITFKPRGRQGHADTCPYRHDGTPTRSAEGETPAPECSCMAFQSLVEGQNEADKHKRRQVIKTKKRVVFGPFAGLTNRIKDSGKATGDDFAKEHEDDLPAPSPGRPFNPKHAAEEMQEQAEHRLQQHGGQAPPQRQQRETHHRVSLRGSVWSPAGLDWADGVENLLTNVR